MKSAMQYGKKDLWCETDKWFLRDRASIFSVSIHLNEMEEYKLYHIDPKHSFKQGPNNDEQREEVVII